MFSAQPDHAGVVAALYAAAGRPDLWPETLATLADYVGAMGGMLTYHALAENKAWVTTARLRDDLLPLYEKEYLRNDYAYAFQRVPTGRAVVANTLVDVGAVRRSAFHADILAPQKVTEVVAVIHPSLTGPSGSGGFAFMLDPTQAGDVARAAARLDGLAPHLGRAVDFTLELSRHLAAAHEIGRLLEVLPTPAALVDRRGRVLQANASLERLFSRRDGLRAFQGEDGLQLAAGTGEETRWLRAMLLRATAAAEGVAEGGFREALRLTGPSGEASLIVVVTPLPPPAFPFWPAVERGARALVQVLDPDHPVRGPIGVLRQAVGLTATEDRVAVLVSEGLSVPEVARELGVSRNTVRTHLARCFDKTGTRSQVALTRLLASIAP